MVKVLSEEKAIELTELLLEHDKLIKDELEQKMFKIYIDKLKQLMDEENKLDYFKYISHISNYFVVEIS